MWPPIHSQKETTSAEIQNLSFPFEIHVAESDIHRFCSSWLLNKKNKNDLLFLIVLCLLQLIYNIGERKKFLHLPFEYKWWVERVPFLFDVTTTHTALKKEWKYAQCNTKKFPGFTYTICNCIYDWGGKLSATLPKIWPF